MEQYDEDLMQNPFLQTLQRNFHDLYEKATSNRYSICIPRINKVKNAELELSDFESHILILIDDENNLYQTVDDKEIIIQNSCVCTGKGFLEQREIPILFEETFFNSKDESYRILCIQQILEGNHDHKEEEDDAFQMSVVRSFDDVREMLWVNTDNPKTQPLLDEQILLFHKTLSNLNGTSSQHLVDAASSLFSKAMQIVLRDSQLKSSSVRNPAFLENLKMAVETYILHGCYAALFKALCTCYAAKDAYLNKITRNLSRLQLRDIGVKTEFSHNVPRGRKELGRLPLLCTPMAKISCLKRAINALTYSSRSSSSKPGHPPNAMSTDDLLPILVFLVVKAEIPNWWAHLAFMINFRFSSANSDDEYGFYLASLQAALAHVHSDALADIEIGSPDPKAFQLSIGASSSSIWNRQDSQNTAVQTLFQYVRDDDRAAVEDILGRPSVAWRQSLSTSSDMCHPLCSCDSCMELAKQREQLLSGGTATVYSRDDKGQTVLHVSASLGHIEMTDVLINKGSVVNTTDYLGATPLHLACQRGHQHIALLLLHNQACINLQDSGGNTPMHVAAAHGHDNCMKAIVYYEQGSPMLNLNVTNDMGNTPLHLAAKWGFYGIVELLLENDASTLVRNRCNQTPSYFAHNVKVLQLLNQAAKQELRHKALEMQASKKDVKGSVRRRHSDAGTMNSLGPPPPPSSDLTDSFPTVSYHKGGPAVANLHPTPVQLKKDPPTQRDRKVEKLLKVVADGDINMVKFFLGWEVDSSEEDEVDALDKTLCHPLCQCKKCQLMQKRSGMTEDGLHVSICNQQGFTPLHVASLHGHIHLTELFLKKGGDVTSRNFSHDATPLHLACKQLQPKVVLALVEHGARVNARDSLGNTPLIYAAQGNNVENARILLQRSASVNGTNRKGNTALHEAVRWHFPQMASLLLLNGAEPTFCNAQNITPLDLIKPHQKEMAALLKKNCVDNKSPVLSNGRLSTIEEPLAKENVIHVIFKDLESRQLRQFKEIQRSIEHFDQKSQLRHVALPQDSACYDITRLHFNIQHFKKQRLRRSVTMETHHPVVILCENGVVDSEGHELS